MELHRKLARGPGAADRIQRQGELLGAARHPGVVELVGVEGSTERPVLVTALVNGPTLAALPALSVDEVAGLAAALASTLADIHQMGIVHGGVAPEHVLVAPDGRPVLCGFGSAGRVGIDEVDPATDLAAFGRLLRRLATGPDARALRRIAEAATADDPAARPSAATVAADLAAAVPGARLPLPRPGPAHGRELPDLRSLVAAGRPERRPFLSRRPAAPAPLLGTELPGPDDQWPQPPAPGPPGAPGRPAGVPIPGPHTRRRRPIRTGVVAGVVGATAAAAILMVAPWRLPQPAAVRMAPATTAPPIAPVTVTSTTAIPSATLPPARSDCMPPAPASVLVADVDGDGCLDALRYSDGVLEAAGTRWALGQAGDQLATGDWACRGTRTVVLLRPSTGQVFRFDGWAVGPSEAVSGTMVATVSGGQALRAADVDRDGCHELVVERGELPPQVVRLPRARP